MKSLKQPTQDQPQDHFQMMMRFVQRERQDRLYNPDTTATWVTFTNFGSMCQTSMQVINMLLSILASGAEYNTVAGLRDVVEQALGSYTVWTKAKVSQTIKAGSVARETLRCHLFRGRVVFRTNLVDGVATDAGLRLIKDTLFCFFSQ
ncbi:hypothetical protein BDV09DRAFT_196681 [Aspergillus tetrazonus]